ncbi:MAG TPA: FtsX-like permease family protein, partial [Vicinamibacterales bacterium]
SRRTQELGIRRALGAQPARLVRDVVLQGLTPVAIGLVAGIGASLWATTYLRSQLFGVSPSDPATYSTVTIGVALVALASCVVPALRALRISPIVALRAE